MKNILLIGILLQSTVSYGSSDIECNGSDYTVDFKSDVFGDLLVGVDFLIDTLEMKVGNETETLKLRHAY